MFFEHTEMKECYCVVDEVNCITYVCENYEKAKNLLYKIYIDTAVRDCLDKTDWVKNDATVMQDLESISEFDLADSVCHIDTGYIYPNSKEKE